MFNVSNRKGIYITITLNSYKLTVYKSKSIQYFLTHIMAEILPYLLNVLVPLPLALTAIQILVVDLGFELFITTSFAWEPPEDKDIILRMGPRKPVTEETIQARRHKAAVTREILGTPTTTASVRGKKDGNHFVMIESTDDLEDVFGSSVASGHTASFSYRARRWLHQIRTLLTDRRYWLAHQREWQSLVTSKKGERLVDSEVLGWSYLEGGMMEAGIGLITFFSVLWFDWGMSADDARNIQWSRGFKPHSPDFETDAGVVLVRHQPYPKTFFFSKRFIRINV
jgi:sodium/potassium-transporting ATPase subunit alpha